MKKLVASFAFAAAVLYGVSAKAAPVDTHVAACADAAGCTFSEPGQANITMAQNDLVVVNDHAGQTIGAVSLHLDPAAGSLFTPTGIVSVLDSTLAGEFIIIVAPAGAPFNGTTGIVGSFLLGNFTGAHLTPCAVGTCTGANGLSEDFVDLGATVLDGALGPNGVSNDFQILTVPVVVPEPTSLVLLGVAAAGLALIRRKA